MTGNNKKTFINPFHFVPLTQPVDPTPVEKLSSLGKPFAHEAPQLSHDRYASSTPINEGRHRTLSGRIVCRLTTKTPCVFGAQHKPGPAESTIVENFSIRGKAAIASTSLKGMVSSLAEMASGSAMRVLNNRALSVRSSMQQSLSALGMVIGHPGNRKIVPLTFPTFTLQNKRWLPTYHQDQKEIQIWDKIVQDRLDCDLTANLTSVYLDREANMKSFSQDGKIYGLPVGLPEIEWRIGSGPRKYQDDRLTKGSILRPAKMNERLTLSPFKSTNDQVPGIVRKISRTQIENTKNGPKFDMFIPIPPEWMCEEDNELDFRKIDPRLALDAENACVQFEAIVTHPFSSAPSESKGASATSLVGGRELRLGKTLDALADPVVLQGDLVFFKPVKSKTGSIIIEAISISGIWRQGPRWLWKPDSGVTDLLDSSDRRPFHNQRKHVSLAEKVFGWVDDNSAKKQKGIQSDFGPQYGQSADISAYKGRVRFSDAVSPQDLNDEVLVQGNNLMNLWGKNREVFYHSALKILSSPKPSCCELYMTDTANSKNQDLRKSFASNSNLQIQGWKYYLVDQDFAKAELATQIDTFQTAKQKPSEKEAAKKFLNQNCYVRPIRPNVSFDFYLDFENLTDVELDLLCYSLRPDGSFLHRLGMGKSLQLGTVQIKPLAIGYIDRVGRYTSSKDLLKQQERYSVVVASDMDDATRESISIHFGGRINSDKQIDSSTALDTTGKNPVSIESRSEKFADRIPELSPIIKRVGQPVHYKDDCWGVTYPYAVQQNGEMTEVDIFKWFSGNRNNQNQLKQDPLQPLSDSSKIEFNH